MKRLRRIAIATTCLSAFSSFVAFNTWLALPPYGRPCVAVLHVPFSEKYFEVSRWMYGAWPLLVFAISTLTAVGCWIALFVKWRSKVRVENREWV